MSAQCRSALSHGWLGWSSVPHANGCSVRDGRGVRLWNGGNLTAAGIGTMSRFPAFPRQAVDHDVRCR
jgi:hypothetical protein